MTGVIMFERYGIVKDTLGVDESWVIRLRNVGYVYAVFLENGTTKIGRTSKPEQRLSTHISSLGKVSKITDVLLSPAHTGYLKSERILCRVNGGHEISTSGDREEITRFFSESDFTMEGIDEEKAEFKKTAEKIERMTDGLSPSADDQRLSKEIGIEWHMSLGVARAAQAAYMNRGIFVEHAFDQIKDGVDITHFEMGFAFSVFDGDAFDKSDLFEETIEAADKEDIGFLFDVIDRGLQKAKAMNEGEGAK